MPRFELNILGCGSAKPTGRHLPSCQVLNVRDNLLMIDCGEGAQMAMARQHLKFSRLRHIFISHLHGDHWFGLPGLLSTLALHEMTGQLTIHIFGDGARLLREMAKYAGGDTPYDLEFDVIGTQPARIYEDNAITVDTITLNHRVPAVGFVIREKPKMRHINPDATREANVPHWAMNSLRQGQDFVTPEGIVIPNPGGTRRWGQALDSGTLLQPLRQRDTLTARGPGNLPRHPSGSRRHDHRLAFVKSYIF